MIRIAVIGGDGVGPEVTAEGMKCLRAAAQKTGLKVQTEDVDISGAAYLAAGGDPRRADRPIVTDGQLDHLRRFDAVYLGAVGHPDIAPGILEQGVLLRLRFALDQYINLRPIELLPGVSTPLAGKGPEDIDILAVRENTEDLYCGKGGVMREGTAQEISSQQMIATRFGVARCLRYAFAATRRRKQLGKPGRLSLVHKTNVLVHCGGTWFRAFEEIGQAEFPDIERQYHHVDACCMYLATRPEDYDVIVVPNMFGDIITDLGAAIAGGMGMAASGNLHPEPGGTSMYEPVHGSAPDIAGQNRANPLAAILSMAMLLGETGRTHGDGTAQAAGDLIVTAVRNTVPRFTGQPMDRLDLGTSEIGDLVAQDIAG